MAEVKYDLLLVPTLTDKKIYNQPWYKERLHTKYIKAKGKNDTSQFLHGKNWTFVKDGLDDFRDGLPPPIEGDIIIHGPKGLSPNIQGSSDNVSSVKQEAAPNRFSKDQVCYSRVTPLQQQRRHHIDEIEYGLKQHPLALYPHLEECMPPDVFEDVVDILDPEMNLASDEEDSYLEDPETETLATPPPNIRMELPREPTREGTEEQKLKNLYRWLPRKEEKAKHEMSSKKQEKRSSSPSQDEHIKTVTKEFCDWVESLGGESNNIEESTIMSLFASGYETKPALSVPIHVVELTNVPPELRMSANVPPPPMAKDKKLSEAQDTKKDWTYSGTYEPSWVKFKYGAWYLSPQTWKKRLADDPLRDPKEIKDEETSEAKKKSNDLDGQLAPMHGAKAFIDFIDNKSTRKPEFLERVGEIQEQTAREEQARLEAEQQAKAKKLNQQDKTKGRK